MNETELLNSLGIRCLYHNKAAQGSYKFKEETEDFVVQEVTESGVSTIAPIVDLSKYLESEEAIKSIGENMSKEERKMMYERIKYFPFVNVKTVDGILKTEESLNDIFVFTLMKYNLNTNDAIQIISKRLGISHRNIQSSGNKDKKGITFQEMSINCRFDDLFNYAVGLNEGREYDFEKYGYKEEFREINSKISEIFSAKMEVKPIESNDRLRIYNIRKGHAKKMGEHTGNRFLIKIRGLFNQTFKPAYFLNYFGPQRFGRKANNHIIGEHILNKRYSDAIDIILDDRPGNSASSDEKDNDSLQKKTAEQDTSSLQRYILKMREKGVPDQKIVFGIERTIRMMYMHAYQSYKFNVAISEIFETKSVKSGTKILQNEVFVDASLDTPINNLYVPLERSEDKFMKGDYRKMIEDIAELEYFEDTEGTLVSFVLKKSSYATSALREIIGDSICMLE